MKEDFDRRRLGLQSYFDKEEIAENMGELQNELLWRVKEVVSHKSYSALQAGRDGYSGAEAKVTAGDAESVSTITNSSAFIAVVEPSCGKRLQFFYFVGTLSHVPAVFACPKSDVVHSHDVLWFCGNESTKTVQFKLLKVVETEIKIRKERYMLSQMKMLI